MLKKYEDVESKNSQAGKLLTIQTINPSHTVESPNSWFPETYMTWKTFLSSSYRKQIPTVMNTTDHKNTDPIVFMIFEGQQ